MKDVGDDKRVEDKGVVFENVSDAEDGNGLKYLGGYKRVEDEAVAVENDKVPKMEIG